jgi:ATP-dependent Clp protease ATP-binding subunit ClpB
MLPNTGRSAARRIANVRYSLPRNPTRLPASRLLPSHTNTAIHRSILPAITQCRFYATGGGKPQPPGGTHRMNLGGEPEKSALEQYGVDLNARAKEGKLDPVIGRDAEIQRTIQILSRRTKNNPVLIGSAGTGKTAIWRDWRNESFEEMCRKASRTRG